MPRLRKIIRIVWVLTGLSFMIGLVYSSQSRGFPDSILQSDSSVSVIETSNEIRFIPQRDTLTAGLIFYPGAMVDPQAYAPMARQLAEAGYIVYIAKLPFRLAYLANQETAVMEQTLEIIHSNPAIQHWVVGGHSRGGALASHFAVNYPDSFSELLLIGTTHPKDENYDLSQSDLNVTKIYATNDGLASPSEIEETSQYLPSDTTWLEIEGGNHAQFGYYGRQLGDDEAEISRAEQQEITVSAILSILNRLDHES